MTPLSRVSTKLLPEKQTKIDKIYRILDNRDGKIRKFYLNRYNLVLYSLKSIRNNRFLLNLDCNSHFYIRDYIFQFHRTDLRTRECCKHIHTALIHQVGMNRTHMALIYNFDTEVGYKEVQCSQLYSYIHRLMFFDAGNYHYSCN